MSSAPAAEFEQEIDLLAPYLSPGGALTRFLLENLPEESLPSHFAHYRKVKAGLRGVTLGGREFLLLGQPPEFAREGGPVTIVFLCGLCGMLCSWNQPETWVGCWECEEHPPGFYESASATLDAVERVAELFQAVRWTNSSNMLTEALARLQVYSLLTEVARKVVEWTR